MNVHPHVQKTSSKWVSREHNSQLLPRPCFYLPGQILGSTPHFSYLFVLSFYCIILLSQLLALLTGFLKGFGYSFALSFSAVWGEQSLCYPFAPRNSHPHCDSPSFDKNKQTNNNKTPSHIFPPESYFSSSYISTLHLLFLDIKAS